MPNISLLSTIFSGRELHLEMSLKSITQQKYNKNLIELLVFLDYPNPSQAINILKNYKLNFHSIRCFLVENKKIAVAHSATRRNFLAKKARGEYLLFSEPEMLHIGPTLRSLFNFLSLKRSNLWYCGPVYATASMVSSAGEITVDEYEAKEDIKFLLNLASKYNNPIGYREFQEYYFQIDEQRYPCLFFCTLLHRLFFFYSGGLNQNLKVRGWEEIEFFERFSKKGGKLFFDKNFITCHLPHKRTLSLTTQIGWNLFNSTSVYDPKQRTGHLAETVREIVL